METEHLGRNEGHEVIRMRLESNVTDVLIKREKYSRGVYTMERPCEDTVSGRPFVRQEERPQEKPTLLAS